MADSEDERLSDWQDGQKTRLNSERFDEQKNRSEQRVESSATSICSVGAHATLVCPCLARYLRTCIAAGSFRSSSQSTEVLVSSIPPVARGGAKPAAGRCAPATGPNWSRRSPSWPTRADVAPRQCCDRCAGARVCTLCWTLILPPQRRGLRGASCDSCPCVHSAILDSTISIPPPKVDCTASLYATRLQRDIYGVS